MPSDEPWVLRQLMQDVLFAHWPAPEANVPAPLKLDRYDGKPWISVVAFGVRGLRPRGLPVSPWLSTFPQINVRTYARFAGEAGVFFLSLDVPRRAVVLAGRRWYRLPYFHARMRMTSIADGVELRHRRDHLGAPPAQFNARYHPIGPPAAARRGTLDHFLTERARLFQVDRGGVVRVTPIEHPPWPLQPVEAEIETNTLHPAEGAPLLRFTRRIEAKIGATRRIGLPP
jgi:uncharacterized protein YqjF (DUF2071 family)